MTRTVSTHTGTGPVAVTPHALASESAVAVMEAGGSAADGVVAANAVLGMVLPTTCGIGGDFFAIVHRDGAGPPEVLNASGRGGSGLDAGSFRASGHVTMPMREPGSVTVPGCIDGWEALVSRHGRRSLADLLAPAIALGRDGFPVSAELASDLRRVEPLIAGQASARALYPGGSLPAAGDEIARPDLADTLAGIAEAGRSAFYTGPVAEAISDAVDGIIGLADLEGNTADWVDPIGVDVFGHTGWTIPPNSQGYLTLAAAMLLEAIDPPRDLEDPAFHHAVIEAYRAVAWERDDLVADPRVAPLPPEALLDPERVLGRLASLRADSVATWPRPAPAPGGTAYFCCVDGEGMAVSAIQSNFSGIGSGISAGTTGVFLQNRGGGFSLVPGHPNEAAPGKRPLHTLAPTLWTRDGRTSLLLGTRGGHQQPQYLTQVAALLLHAGLSPAEAQVAPRWHAESWGPGSAVAVEERMPATVVQGLAARGHEVSSHPDWPQGWGPVSIIDFGEDGTRTGVADPRVTSASAAGA